MLLVTSRSVMPTYCGARAVDVDVEAGIVERLLDAGVGQARNMPQLAQQRLA